MGFLKLFFGLILILASLIGFIKTVIIMPAWVRLGVCCIVMFTVGWTLVKSSNILK